MRIPFPFLAAIAVLALFCSTTTRAQDTAPPPSGGETLPSNEGEASSSEPATETGTAAPNTLPAENAPAAAAENEPPELTPPPSPPVSAPPEPGRLLVRSGSNESPGFIYGDSSHIITLQRVVRHRGPIRVVLPSGAAVRAELVSGDGQLALLRVEGELGSPTAVRLDVRAGDVLGRVVPRGELSGLVLARRANRLQVSAICDRGALLFDGEGRIAAICTGGDRATSAEAFAELWNQSEDGTGQSAWRPRLTMDFRYRIQKGFDSVFAGELGFGMVGWDRLGFALRVGLAADAQQNDGGTLRIELPIETTAEVQVHQTFRVGRIPVRLVLAVGGLFRVDRRSDTRTFSDFGGCDPSTTRCEVRFERETSETTEYRFLPNLRVEVNLGTLALTYAATLEVARNIEDTTHSLGVGFAF